jgi:hypothetical protein
MGQACHLSYVVGGRSWGKNVRIHLKNNLKQKGLEIRSGSNDRASAYQVYNPCYLQKRRNMRRKRGRRKRKEEDRKKKKKIKRRRRSKEGSRGGGGRG